MKLYYSLRGELNQSEEAKVLLETAFRHTYNESMPKIKKTPNGKPYFADRSDIHFSLSHTKTHILCALSHAPIGVDIESTREISSRAKAFFCTEEELKYFQPLELWVLKESYIKLFGSTLKDMKKIHFTRVGDEIITPDKSVTSRLYTVDSCNAAVSSLCASLPDSIERL